MKVFLKDGTIKDHGCASVEFRDGAALVKKELIPPAYGQPQLMLSQLVIVAIYTLDSFARIEVVEPDRTIPPSQQS